MGRLYKVISAFFPNGWATPSALGFLKGAQSSIGTFLSGVQRALTRGKIGGDDGQRVLERYPKGLAERLAVVAKGGVVGSDFVEGDRFRLDGLLSEARGAQTRQTLREKPYFSALIGDNLDRVADVVAVFDVGGMSHGALSEEVHSDIARGANGLGIVSNSGEGGESVSRRGTSANSAIKQVASGRFGVDSGYLISADEVQIKLAQAAKPGEGGELPGWKNIEVIAKNRHATVGQTLISPPPNHDVYSIEDLFLLIHAIKCVKPGLSVGVKLVSERDVAMVALGAVKAGADVIEIAGNEGGTGSAKFSSIFNTGFPWETGLYSTHRFLEEAGVRHLVTLVASGGCKTSWDVVLATLLGADRVSEATGALVSLGCQMLRQCHKSRTLNLGDLKKVVQSMVDPDAVSDFANDCWDSLVDGGYIQPNGAVTDKFKFDVPDRVAETEALLVADYVDRGHPVTDVQRAMVTALAMAKGGCSFNVATQDRSYRQNYKAKPSMMQDFFIFQALGVTDYLGQMGCRSLSEIRGRALDFLTVSSDAKITGLDAFLGHHVAKADHKVLESPVPIPCVKDLEVIEAYRAWKLAGGSGEFRYSVALTESDISFGVALGSYRMMHGVLDTFVVTVKDHGVGPQNLGVWLAEGVTIVVENSVNDHLGKGNSGGVIVVKRPTPQASAVVGNQLLYGMTAGEVYLDADAGTRFGVRLSGGKVVVANVGDHALEFMTGGSVLIKGTVGRNFASGMTGGIAILRSEYVDGNEALRPLRFLTPTLAQTEVIKALLQADFDRTGAEDSRLFLAEIESGKCPFKVYDPQAIDQTMMSHLKEGALLPVYPLSGDQCVGSLIAFIGMGGKGVGLPSYPEIEAIGSFGFSGNGGDYVLKSWPKGLTATVEHGKMGHFFGYGLSGKVNLNGVTTKSRAFCEGKASSVVSGGGCSLGEGSLSGFAGVAVVGDVGEGSCRGLRAGAKVVVLGRATNAVLSGFGEGLSADAELYLNLDKNPEFKGVLDRSGVNYSVEATVPECAGIELSGELGQLVRVTPEMVAAVKEVASRELLSRGAGSLGASNLWTAMGWDSAVLAQIVIPMAKSKSDEPGYSMGNQSMPIATAGMDVVDLIVEGFAQETRPSVDSKKEGALMDTQVVIGGGRWMDYAQFVTKGKLPVTMTLASPLLSEAGLDDVENRFSGKTSRLDMTFDASKGPDGLLEALERLKREATSAEMRGSQVLVLDHGDLVVAGRAFIPSYLAAAVVTGLGLKLDVIVRTHELVTPHLLDVLVNVGGAKGVVPVSVERYLKGQTFDSVLRSDRPVGGHEGFENYTYSMDTAWKRIISKDGMTNGAMRVGAKSAYGYLLDEDVCSILGISQTLGHFGIPYVADRAVSQLHSAMSGEPLESTHRFRETPATQGSQQWHAVRARQVQRSVGLIRDIEDLSGPGPQSLTTSYQDYQAYERGVVADNRGRTIRGSFDLKPLKRMVAVVGGGISAIAMARALADSPDIDHVVIYGGSVPVLGGKVAFAVAPDHLGPKTTLETQLAELLENPKVELVLGRRLSEADLDEVVSRHSLTVLATGAKTNRWEGDYISSSKVVAWYNDKPSKSLKAGEEYSPSKHGRRLDGGEYGHRACPVDVTGRHLGVYGFGNVALDVVRMFAQDPAGLQGRVSASVLEDLNRSTLTEFTIVGRAKSPLDTKFSLKELRELKASVESRGGRCCAFFDAVDLSRVGELSQEKLAILEFFNSIRVDRYEASTGGKQVNFVFGVSQDQLDVESVGAGVSIRSLVAGGLRVESMVTAIGATKTLPITDITSESGRVFTQLDGDRVELPQLLVVGQADTGRGQVGDAIRSVNEVMNTVTERVSQLPGKPYTPAWNFDRFSECYTKEDYRDLRAYLLAGNAAPMTVEGYRQLRVDLRRNRAGVVAMGLPKNAVNMLGNTVQTPPLHPVEVKVTFVNRSGKKSSTIVSGKGLNTSLFTLMGGLGAVARVPDIEDVVSGTCGSGSCGECSAYLYAGSLFPQRAGVSEVKVGESFLPCQYLVKDAVPVMGSGAIEIRFGYKPLNVATPLMSPPIGDKSSCGVGMSWTAEATEDVVSCAVSQLGRYLHRGSMVNGYGDGAGVVFGLDCGFFDQKSSIDHTQTPYGICGVFLPHPVRNPVGYQEALKNLAHFFNTQGLEVAFVRDSLTDDRVLSPEAQQDSPGYVQLFIKASSHQKNAFNADAFELSLNKAGVILGEERWAKTLGVIPLSCSSQYVNYKGRLRGDQLGWFKDLQVGSGLKARFYLDHIRYSTTTLSKPKSAHPFGWGGVFFIHNGEVISSPQIKQFLEALKETVATEFGFTYCTEGLTDSELTNLYFGVMNMISRHQVLHLLDPTRDHDDREEVRAISLGALAYMMLSPDKNNVLSRFAKIGLPVAEGPFNFGLVGSHHGRQTCFFMKDRFGFRPAVIEKSAGKVAWMSELLNRSGVVGVDSQVAHAKEGVVYMLDIETGVLEEYVPETHDAELCRYLERRLSQLVVA